MKQAKHFTAICNITLQKSKLTLPNLPNQLSESRLQGQAPYVINAGLYYQNDSSRLQVSLLYNVVGTRIYAIGSTFYGSTAEQPFHSLDLLLSYGINKYISLNGGVQNILNQQVRFVLDNNRDEQINKQDAVIKSYKTGIYTTIGIKVNLNP